MTELVWPCLPIPCSLECEYARSNESNWCEHRCHRKSMPMHFCAFVLRCLCLPAMYFWRPALSQQGHSVTTYEGSRDKNIGNGMDWLKRAHHIENRGHALQDRMRALEMDVALLRPPTSLPEVLQELEDRFACAAQTILECIEMMKLTKALSWNVVKPCLAMPSSARSLPTTLEELVWCFGPQNVAWWAWCSVALSIQSIIYVYLLQFYRSWGEKKSDCPIAELTQNCCDRGQETEQLSWLSIISWIICRCGWKNGIESIAARPGWRFGIWSRLFDMNIWRWTSKLQQASATSRIQHCGVAVSLAWQERIKSALALGKKMQEVRWAKAEAGRLWTYLNIARVMNVRFGLMLQNGHTTL